jgi:hypothetical protein
MASSPKRRREIHFPSSGRTSALAPSVPEAFLAELQRGAIPFAAGQCLVDADANDAPRLSRSFAAGTAVGPDVQSAAG